LIHIGSKTTLYNYLQVYTFHGPIAHDQQLPTVRISIGK